MKSQIALLFAIAAGAAAIQAKENGRAKGGGASKEATGTVAHHQHARRTLGCRRVLPYPGIHR